jgi:hypothetical protein
VQIVKFSQHEQEIWRLSTEGMTIAEKGSHEARVFDAVAKSMEGLTIDELRVYRFLLLGLEFVILIFRMPLEVRVPSLDSQKHSKTNGSEREATTSLSSRYLKYTPSCACTWAF